jgi:hypothetical protein
MPKFDTRPTQVDIDHYAGDTLSIRINVSSTIVAGRVWKAQVRTERTALTVAAEFVCIPDTDGCTIMLASADCKTLARAGVYKGFWDVQVAETGGLDPVTTFGGGKLNIYPDVTRQT